MLAQLIFLALSAFAIYLFGKNAGKIGRNIHLGLPENRSDRKSERLKTMLWVAFGQSKMQKRPVAAILHLFVYLGFVIINIEVLEILIDGLLGTHRFFAHYFGSIYDVAIGFFEILALGVLVACVVFLARRFVTKVPRLQMPELKGWPVKDATIILVVEVVLMGALLMMNAAEQMLVNRDLMEGHGSFPVSQYLVGFFDGFSDGSVHMIERLCWWFHFVGIVVFLNYVPYSKHWHIIMSFPNVYYTPLKPKGEFENLGYVTTEVKLMMDPAAQPPDGYEPPAGFGAKDVQDLTWKNLMDAYTCTECGRCSSVCPANQTGKLLSPRKVMMDTRDRLEEVGRGIDAAKKLAPQNGETVTIAADKNAAEVARFEDGKDLHSYISTEELWACTTCNACVEACPVNINPVDIIVQMRQYQVMEKSAAPSELNNMFTNLENNGAPWQFNQMDKANWTQG